MKTLIITVALVMALVSGALAGGLVYDLNSDRIYKVERDGDSTRVYNLGPGEGQVTIGRRLPSGSSYVIQTPGRHDGLAEGLAIQDDEDRSEDGED